MTDPRRAQRDPIVLELLINRCFANPLMFPRILAFIGAILWSSIAFTSEERVALVIGNAGYSSAPLRNPANDALAMTRILKALGFDVVHITDGGRDEMTNAVIRFAGKLNENTVGLFYYAGHGIQVRGRNYLIPVDSEPGSEAEVRARTVAVSAVLDEMEYAANRLNIVILDACRNNPSERRFRGGSRGLAAIDAAGGTLIAYATSPGSVAADGDGKNGLYTEELLQALAIPGLEVEEVFKRVRIEVAQKTQHEQIPWESSSLTGNFIFNTSEPVSDQTTTSVEMAAVEAELSALKREKEALEAELKKALQGAKSDEKAQQGKQAVDEGREDAQPAKKPPVEEDGLPALVRVTILPASLRGDPDSRLRASDSSEADCSAKFESTHRDRAQPVWGKPVPTDLGEWCHPGHPQGGRLALSCHYPYGL